MDQRRAGFTLVEIIVVTLVIGIMAAIAIPAFLHARKITQMNRFIGDLRILSDGMVQLVMSTGNYPPDRQPGEVPAGMTNFVRNIDWSKPTVIGGLWDWDYQTYQFGGKAGISVHGPDWSAEEMQEIDARIDDGNLSTGYFRQNGTHYTYLIER